jgi:anti-sigma B factor antagonist
MTTISPYSSEEPDVLGELCDLLQATLTQPHPEVVIIAAAGELDMASGDLLRRAIEHAIARRPKRILVDLATVTFFGSTGMAVLTQGRALASTQGIRLQLRGARHRAVALPLRYTGLENLFDIVD